MFSTVCFTAPTLSTVAFTVASDCLVVMDLENSKNGRKILRDCQKSVENIQREYTYIFSENFAIYAKILRLPLCIFKDGSAK